MNAPPSLTSSAPSPSERSSLLSPSPSPYWRFAFVSGTLGLLVAIVLVFLARPPLWGTVLAVVSIPAVSISLSYFGGASIHTTIAYTTIRKEAARSRAEYLRLIHDEILPPAVEEIKRSVAEQIAAIQVPEFPDVPDYGPAIAELRAQLDTLPELRAQLDTIAKPDVGKQLEQFLASDEGRAWTGALAEACGAEISNVMTARVTSAAGAAARSAQSSLVKLLDGAISFGNPILDGLWAMCPREAKLKLYNELARVLRRSGLLLTTGGPIVDGEGRVVTDDESGDADALAAWEPARWSPVR